MIDYCPHVKILECSRVERTEEFFRQMHEAMLYNKPIFLTGGTCHVCSSDCMKLREYQERLQKQR
jgi:hypothetical protein